MHAYFRTAVIFGIAFLQPVTQNLRYRHTGNTKFIQSFLQDLKTQLRSNDHDLRHFRSACCRQSGSNVSNGSTSLCCFLSSHSTMEIFCCRHKIGIRAGQTMLFHIQPGDFLTRADPQSDSFIEDLKNQRHHDTDIRRYRCNSCRLNDQQLTAAAVQQTAVYCKNTNQQRAQRTTDSMYRNCADRIVDSGNLVKKFYCKNDHKPGNDTDHKSSRNTDCVTASSNSDQSCQRAVQGHRYIRLAVTQPGQEHRCRRGRGSGHISSNKDPAH